jgi:hypothetical protein
MERKTTLRKLPSECGAGGEENYGRQKEDRRMEVVTRLSLLERFEEFP